MDKQTMGEPVLTVRTVSTECGVIVELVQDGYTLGYCDATDRRATMFRRIFDEMKRVPVLEDENKRLRDALEWYADKKNYFAMPYEGGTEDVVMDAGDRARAALAEYKEATNV